MSKLSRNNECKPNNGNADEKSAGRSEYIEFLIMFILIIVAITVFFLLLKYFPKLVLAGIGGLFLFIMLIGAVCSGGGSSYRGSSGCSYSGSNSFGAADFSDKASDKSSNSLSWYGYSLYNRSLYESGNWYDYYKTEEYYNETK